MLSWFGERKYMGSSEDGVWTNMDQMLLAGAATTCSRGQAGLADKLHLLLTRHGCQENIVRLIMREWGSLKGKFGMARGVKC
jgi:hypothetical protein